MKKSVWMLAAALVCGAANMATVNAAADPAAIKKAAADSAAMAPKIEFVKTSHDFGTFPEERGKVTCTFTFKNTGKSDLILQKVRASCGCTTPNWTKTPVAPGDTGFVTATYNASGRPGAFNKTITVTSNADANMRLTIKGEVIPKVKSPEEEYPSNIGDFRLKTNNVYMRTIEYPLSKTEKIQVMNNSDKDMAITFANAPKYLTLKAVPATLKPKEKGVIEVSFSSEAANDWGEILPTFDVAINGNVEKDKKITVHATVRENFANLTPEQKAVAPVMTVNTVNEIGVLAKGDKKKVKISVTNTGKSDLLIHKVKTNNENAKVVSWPTKAIKPGKKADIQFVVGSENAKQGNFSYRATIICNDPNNSTSGISLKGSYNLSNAKKK